MSYSLSSEEVREIWQQTCQDLQSQVTPAVYNTWIISNSLTEIELIGDTGARCTLTSPTAFHSTNVKKNLSHTLTSALSKVLGREPEILFRIGTPIRTETQNSTYVEPNVPDSAIKQSTQHSSYQAQERTQNTPEPNFNVVAQISPLKPQRSHQASSPATTHQPGQPQPTPNSGFFNSPRVEDLFSQANMQANTVDRARVAAQRSNLRVDYTFDTFAVSTTNEMAHAAATAVSQRPGTAYNPLFLYGGVGVGKTHLMHAIGTNILTQNPDTRIIYCTGEEFTNEIVSAIQNKKALKFKDKYRTAQVLLIDDVQFIAGKNAVQEEFFHTFNALIQQARQIVMTSDRPPHEINLLEDRLRSRFEAGLMIDIQQPSFELRTAILLIKAKAQGLDLPMDIAQQIAAKVDSARKIEGIIKSILSAVELRRRELSFELVEEILHTEIETTRSKLRVNPNDIMRAVANHYRVKQTALKGKRRVQNIVMARHVAMYLLKEDLDLPLAEIGRWFSNRDHTTALHACRKIEEQLSSDSLLQRDISALRMSLSAISK